MKIRKVSNHNIYFNAIRLIFHNIVSLLLGQGLLLLLFFVVSTPLISYVYQLTLRVTGFSHVTIDNLKEFLFHPLSIFMFFLLFCIIGVFLLLEIYYLTIFFGQVEQYKRVKVFWVILRGIYKLVVDLKKRNIGLIPGAWSTLAIFNLPFFLFVIYKTRVMRYFASETSTFVMWVMIAVLAGLIYRMLFKNLFIFQNHLLGHMTWKEAKKWGKDKHSNDSFSTFLYFLGWNIIITLIIAALYLFLMGVTVLLSSSLFNKQMAIATFIYLIENMKTYLMIIIFLICTIGNLALYTHLFYIYRMKTADSGEMPEKYAFIQNIDSIGKGSRSFKKIVLAGLLILSIVNLYFFVKILRNGSPLDNMNLDQIAVTSHRGFSHDVPENTLPAIEKAIEEKADYVEVDVRVTKDGVPVLLHDNNLKRITGVDKYIWQVTYAELATLDAGKWMDKQYAGTRIPTLEEVLESCKGRINLNLDLKYHSRKERLEEKVIALIDQYEMEWQCVISSTNLYCLEQIKELNPDIQTGYISYQLYPGLIENESVDFFSMKSSLITKNLLRKIHENGKKLVVWTVDSRLELERLERIGVDNIITDNPAYAREVLYESKSKGYFVTLLKIMME